MLKRCLKTLPTAAGLPDPNKGTDPEKQDICLAANLSESLLRSMGWTKRKGTKDGRNVPPPEVLGPMKDAYLQTIQTIVQEHDIPVNMMVNVD